MERTDDTKVRGSQLGTDTTYKKGHITVGLRMYVDESEVRMYYCKKQNTKFGPWHVFVISVFENLTGKPANSTFLGE